MRKHKILFWTMAILLISAAASILHKLQEAGPFGAFATRALAASLNKNQNAPPPNPDQEQPEILTRGPVHEAFAEPVNLQVQAGLVAPLQPPDPIEETPPTEKPEGDNFVWLPGYWSWDGERNNYIWVCACWRAAPPNMSWVSGYWGQVADGWEWVAGFWQAEATQEIEYLPAPPATEDVEAPGVAPLPDHVWVPSCWYWRETQYVRRPGYWLAAHPGWVWTPSHYVFTPRGYIFAHGHWDYPVERRGILFAPVYFPRSVYVRRGFAYSPSIVVDLGVLETSLFAYPRYSHYYFGDYYDEAYVRVGIYPRFDSGRIHTWYDPIYEYDRARFRRTDSHWEERERHDYDRRRADVNLRPARTYYEMETRLAKLPEPERKNFRMAQPLTTVVTSKTTTLKFEKITTESRQKIVRQATDVHKFRAERTRLESPAASPKAAPTPAERRDAPKPPPAERKEPAAATADRKAPFVPARKVDRNQPERVKIPATSTAGKARAPAAGEKTPPPRPTDENKQKPEAKDARKDNGDRKSN